MALRKTTEGSSNWNQRMPFPQDIYEVTCIEEEFGVSSKKNPMITRKWEIVKPEVVNGVSVAGAQLIEYVVCKNWDEDAQAWDAKKSDQSFGNLKTDLILLGHNPAEDIDDENPPLLAKGKTVLAYVYAKGEPALKAPTPEQLAKGQKQGDKVMVDGKEVLRYQLKLGEKHKVVSTSGGAF